MGNQVIILACIGTFNPDLITAKLAPVLTEAGLQIEGASTVYEGQHHLAIGRPDDLNAALDRLNVSRVLAPEKKEGGPPPSADSTAKAKGAKAGKKEAGPPLVAQPPLTTGPVGEPGPVGPVGIPAPEGGNDEPEAAHNSPQTETCPEPPSE